MKRHISEGRQKIPRDKLFSLSEGETLFVFFYFLGQVIALEATLVF